MTEETPAALILICFMLLHGFITALNCTSPTPRSLYSALEQTLFPQKLVPPKETFTDPINITISVVVVGILGVDEKAQTLTTVLWQTLWDIEGLSWDEKECGATRLSVPREKLWVPDVIISEFMDEEKSPTTPYIYLYNTGRVFDDKPIRVVTACQLQIYTFPFDVQNCSLTFGSYLHFATDIRMVQGYTPEEALQESRRVLETNGEWELAYLHIDQVTLTIDMGNYSEIKYHVILRRRPMLYVVNLLIPSCFLITVDLFSFLLPPQSVDRSAFKMTLILGYTVFLLIMNDLLPVTGETTPLINVFFSISLALMVTSLLETVFITNIQFSSSQYSAVPPWLSVLVLRYLAIVVCLPPRKKSNRITVSLKPPTAAGHPQTISDNKLSDKPPLTPLTSLPSMEPSLNELRKMSRDLMAIRLQIDKHFLGNNTSQEWQMIGIVIDRLLFGLYIVFILVSFVTVISIWIWNSSYAEQPH